MLHFPEACRKAQAEIDAVIGRDRLPSFEDKENLHFTRGFILETQRWRPLTPIGVPHVALEVRQGTICVRTYVEMICRMITGMACLYPKILECIPVCGELLLRSARQIPKLSQCL